MESNKSIAPREWGALVAAVRTTPSKESYAALREAFESAAWGRNGSAFVTRWSHWPSAQGYIRTLWLQGRRVATCDYRGYATRGWVEVIDPAQAEEEYRERKARSRKYDRQYKAERSALIADLVAEGHREAAPFGEWHFAPGQKGGVWFRSDNDGCAIICVAAESALRAAEALRPFIYFAPDVMEEDMMDESEFAGKRPPVRKRGF